MELGSSATLRLKLHTIGSAARAFVYKFTPTRYMRSAQISLIVVLAHDSQPQHYLLGTQFSWK